MRAVWDAGPHGMKEKRTAIHDPNLSLPVGRHCSMLPPDAGIVVQLNLGWGWCVWVVLAQGTRALVLAFGSAAAAGRADGVRMLNA